MCLSIRKLLTLWNEYATRARDDVMVECTDLITKLYVEENPYFALYKRSAWKHGSGDTNLYG
jgi:hypothetical protein